MKLSAMPASVDSSAARGVALRRRSAIGAHAELDDARGEGGEESRLPRDARRIRRAGRDRQRLRRQHHEEHVREERDGVDAVGQRADVGAAGARRQALGLEARRATFPTRIEIAAPGRMRP